MSLPRQGHAECDTLEPMGFMLGRLRIAALPVLAGYGPARLIRKISLVVLVGVVAFFTVYPILLLIVSSFRPPIADGAFSLFAYETAFRDPRILPSLLNTFILAVIRTSLSMAFAIFFAWVVTRTNVPMRGFIEFMLW